MTTRSTTAVRAAATIVLLVLGVGCAKSDDAAGGSSGTALSSANNATATVDSSAADGSTATSSSTATGSSITTSSSIATSSSVPAGGSSAPGGSASEADSTPAQEGSGAEAPQAPKKGGPSISVASLPVGGNVDVEGARQCGHVNLITHDQLPPGISISIDSIGLSSDDIFALHGDLCGSARPCTTSWTWTTDTAGSACTVAVTQVRQVPNSTYSAELVLGGTVTCPNQDACNQVQSGFDGNGSGTHIVFEASTEVAATDPSTDSNGSTAPTSSESASSSTATTSSAATKSSSPAEASTARS